MSIPILSTNEIFSILESALLDMKDGNELLKTRGITPPLEWHTIRDRVDDSLTDGTDA